MSECELKSSFNKKDVCLPFAHPLVKTSGQTVWPFSQSGFPLFNGLIDTNNKCIQIFDPISVSMLQNMGYFGFTFFNDNKQSLSDKRQYHTNESVFEIKNSEKIGSKKELSQANSETKSRKSGEYLNGRYVLVSTSIPNSLESSHGNSFEEKKLETSDQYREKVDNRFHRSLRLGFEESFFLSYVFGSLNVMDTETKSYLAIEQMWTHYSSNFSSDPFKFAANYCAYHYFRSKGWVVRNGDSFGTDYLLYREGPPFYHALYSVTIDKSIDANPGHRPDWLQVSALIRLSKNVRKELLVCIVNIPENIDITSPDCIQSFNIELLHFDRWIASKGLNDLSEKS